MRYRLIAGILGVGLILLTAWTGKSDAVDSLAIQDNAALPAGALTGSNPIGQTFVFHYPRLRAIEVRWVVSADLAYSSASRIVLHLRRANSSFDAATTALPLSALQPDEYSRFEFPPIPDSQNQAFYFYVDAAQVEITRGYVSLWASGADDYPDGAMDLAGQPTERDLVLRAYYEPDLAFLAQSFQDTLTKYWSAFAFALLLPLLLGLALVFLWSSLTPFDLSEGVALANGLGLGVLSAGAFLVLAFGVSTERLVAIVALVVVSGVAALIFRARAAFGFFAIRNSQFRNSSFWTLAALALLSLGVGLLQIRDLAVPLWVDSPAHAAFIQTLVESAPLLASAFYHFGFHTLAALIVRLSGVSIPVTMLVLGQLLITQIGLGAFLLAKRLSGSAAAGLASAACVWFLSPTPAYFLTWGRYPLLLGAALLPLALFAAVVLIEQPRLDWRVLFYAAILCVGMSFAHFRLILFYVVFLVVYLALRAPRRPAARRVAGVLGASALLGLVWLATLFARHVSAADILRQNAGAQMIDVSTAFAILQLQHGREVIVLTAIGAAIALLRRSRAALVVLVWFAVLVATSLVGGELIAPSFVLLMGFMPAALLIGDLARAVIADAETRAGWVIVLVVVSLLGARDMASIVNPATILYSRADEPAMAWIKTHTPGAARFLVNSFDWFEGAFVPADGGGWIPYLAQRSVVFLDASSQAAGADAAALARWVESQQVTYVYLGRRAGVLSRTFFACQPARYTPRYDRDGVTIFSVRQAGAAEQSAVPLRVDCGR